MKLAETCACGAKIDVEDDDPDRVRADVTEWRVTHRHIDGDPWRRDVASTTAADLGFGFMPEHTRPVEAM